MGNAARSERGLKQLPDGRWRWSYKDPQGRYHRFIARTKTEARTYLEKTKTTMREERYLDKRKVVHTPFEDAVEEFLKWSKINVRPSTYAGDQNYCRLWMASPHLTGKTLDVITVTDVEAYRTQRVSGKKGVSQRTADADLSRLKRLFSLCQTWGLCETNPVKSVKFFNPECMRERFISTEEEALLIEHAPRDLRNCITFAVNTGLRLREMLTLTWGQVDLKRGLVTVSADVAKNKKTRHVPLNDSAKAVLESLPRNIDPNALVFPKYGGEVFGKRSKDARSFYKAWQKTRDAAIADELDGRELCWHTLRHTFASRLVIAGVPLNAVQQLMGHRSIQMVMRYAHLAPDHLKNAVHLLDSKLQFSCTRPQPAETEKAP